MAAPEKTYDNASIREDLSNEIENISPITNFFLKNMQKTKAKATTHITLVEELKAPGINSIVEGAATAFGDRTRPTRVDNLTQIIEIPFSVSSTEQWVDHAGMGKRYDHEAEKAMKEWGNDAEFAIVRSVRQTGNASTARRMEGIIPGITTNIIDGNATSVWNEDMLNDLSELAWWEGGAPKDLFVGPALKRATSGFTQGDNQFDASKKKKVNTVSVYEGDFEVIDIHLHRFVDNQADTSYKALLLELDKWALAYGEKPFEEELPTGGNDKRGHVRGEFTIENRAENANAKAFDVLAA